MKIITFWSFLFCGSLLIAQEGKKTPWELAPKGGIVLKIDSATSLPLTDNIEMSGKRVSAIIYYEIDQAQNLTLRKDVIFPQLRVFNKSNEPDWKKYRAYFRREVDARFSPQITYNQLSLVYTKVDSIRINGMLTFHYAPVKGLKLIKRFYPSMDDRLLVEELQLVNLNEQGMELSISNLNLHEAEAGYKGTYAFICQSRAKERLTLAPGQSYTFPLLHGALLNDESSDNFDFVAARNSREAFLQVCKDNLSLQTPDSILNTLFYFAKIRASESIFESSMGLVHSPGGGNYYVGIWANDQVEYSGPFFPYLGYEVGNQAAYNTYQKFLENIPEDDGHIAYAFEVDGNFPMTHLDRGDAAMIAYGTSLYLLNSGDKAQARKLWPLIQWALEYCETHKNAAGAIMSQSDEMEGRIETGDANLSTSSLYYGGLKFGAPIAEELGKPAYARTLRRRQKEMERVIENYFGATIQGFESYRYYEANTRLRHWICLPLTMGITKRKEGTLAALFQKLWTDNGILVEYNEAKTEEEQVFWDRATLYALRGAMKVGEIELALGKLKAYSAERLLGDHVPYPVEAYPENNMKHLSAESALYCRIFLEGLLGIEPVNFSEFTLRPHLPKEWDYLHLDNFFMLGRAYTLSVVRADQQYTITVKSDSETVYRQQVNRGERVVIKMAGK